MSPGKQDITCQGNTGVGFGIDSNHGCILAPKAGLPRLWLKHLLFDTGIYAGNAPVGGEYNTYTIL